MINLKIFLFVMCLFSDINILSSTGLAVSCKFLFIKFSFSLSSIFFFSSLLLLNFLSEPRRDC